jgi:hypothetical protein
LSKELILAMVLNKSVKILYLAAMTDQES